MLKSKMVATFNMPVSFSCMDNCGLCCSYKVHLLPSDTKKMGDCLPPEAGFNKDGHLSKQNGYCRFLGKDNRCTVYDNRPSYCRTFPFYMETGSEIDIDLSCPGVGRGDEVYEQFPVESYADAAAQNDSCFCPDNPSLNEKLVASQPGYISHHEFKQMGLTWCGELCEVNSITEFIDSAASLAKHKSPSPLEAPGLPTDFFDIVGGVNTHINSGKNLVRYAYEIRNDSFSINGQKYLCNDLENNSRDRLNHMSPEELDTIREYLRVWFRRHIFYRFCLISSLGAPMLYSPVSVAFAFMANLIGKVCSIADLLQLYWAKREGAFDETEAVREAIRVFDGRLRTKCRAVGIQTFNQNKKEE